MKKQISTEVINESNIYSRLSIKQLEYPNESLMLNDAVVSLF